MKHPAPALILCTLLAASGGAWAQHVPQAVRHEIHTCGYYGCYDASSGGSGSRSGSANQGTYRPTPTLGHRVERGYGSAAVGVTQQNRSDNSGNLAEIYTAVSHSRETADRDALDKCSRYGGKNCIVIARVANACTNISKAYGWNGSHRGDLIPAPTRFYVSPYVTPQELPDNNGNSLQGGVERRAKETARAACDADAARNKHACEHSGTTLCAWDQVRKL